MSDVEQKPHVTWLIPVKNGMPYLPETLESILQETYPNRSVLVWDNGSTDGTLEELERWIPSRIPGKIVRDRPLGLGACLAAMVEMADSEFLARIDADDLTYPDRLEKQVRFMLENPKVGVVGSQAFLMDDEGRYTREVTYQNDDPSIHWGAIWRPDLWHPSVLFRKSVVLAAGNYRDCRPYEDHELWRRMSMICELRNLPENLVKRREHAASITGQVLNYRGNHEVLTKMNEDILFPGMPRDVAHRLWDLVYYDSVINNQKIRLSDMRNLKKAAILLARKIGKPDDYFLNNIYYYGQQYHLRRQWMEQNGLGILLSLKRQLKGGQRAKASGAEA